MSALVPQFVVETLQRQQLLVAPLLCHLPLLYHKYHIHILDGGEAVGDGDGGPPLLSSVQRVLDNLLALGVQGGGGLVQQQDGGVAEHGTGDGHPLLLATGQLLALATNVGLITLKNEILLTFTLFIDVFCLKHDLTCGRPATKL